MKILTTNSNYSELSIADTFNKMISEKIDNYDGTRKEKLKSFFEDLQHGGCVSGMIGEFIYKSDCKSFYVENIDDLESIKEDLEENLGGPIENRFSVPHYTFMCWLCFEEYCYNIYNNIFEN